MKIRSTSARFTGLGATLVAGMVLLSDTGAGHALEGIVHAVAQRDHRQGGSHTTSSAKGGVLVDGKEGEVTTRSTYRPSPIQYGKDWERVNKGNLRDHRSK